MEMDSGQNSHNGLPVRDTLLFMQASIQSDLLLRDLSVKYAQARLDDMQISAGAIYGIIVRMMCNLMNRGDLSVTKVEKFVTEYTRVLASILSLAETEAPKLVSQRVLERGMAGEVPSGQS